MTRPPCISSFAVRYTSTEDQLRAQFMAIPVPTYAWRVAGDCFELEAFNQAALRLTNGRIRDWVGRRASEMFTGGPVDYAQAMRECLAADRPVRLELPHRLVTTGELREFVVHFAPVQPDQVLVHTVDETDRRAAETALRASEERFRALIENSLELVSILDRDGNFQYASPTYEAVLGYAPDALIGTSPFDLIHPDDLGQCRASLGSILAQPARLVPTRFRIRDRHGMYRLIELTAKNLLDHPAIDGIVCNGRDVTEREAADAELRFRAHLLDTVEQAVIATKLNGAITYWNRFAERLHGWRADEVMGRDIATVTPGRPTRVQTDELTARLIRGESWSGEFEMQTRDGRRFPAHVTDSPIRDDAGRLIGIVRTSTNLTERRELEEQLRQSQKLEAIGKLAGGVAHDFNNLLTVIAANAEFVRSAVPADSEAHAELSEVVLAVERASGLTRQLLAFSRKQVLTPQPLDLNSVVADMHRLLDRLIGEHITLATELAEPLGLVFADRGQIEQVLMNLAVNARDAMPDGGTLSIATSDVDLDESLMVDDGVEPGRYVMLSVTDTGGGMDRATMQRIFEPFFTTKEAGRGTGLGLSTVYGIVRQSRGYVWAHSQPGQGAVFKVCLPRHELAAFETVDATCDSVRGGNERVLLVEDEDGVRLIARRVLEKLGYRVTEAWNGREALVRFRQMAGDVDLVLTDAVMPEMGGRELVETLRKQHPALRALYMSGYTEDELLRRGLDAATHFIAKPFTGEALAMAVRRALDPA